MCKRVAKITVAIFLVAASFLPYVADLIKTTPGGSKIETAQAALANTRSKTVEVFIGQYSGNGTTGQNSDTNQTFSPFTFSLAESGVVMKSAFVIFESQFEAYANNAGNYTGYDLAFDACMGSCTPVAFTGSGRALNSDTSVLAYDETESNGIRLLLDATGESQLATYTGNGAVVTGEFGYNLKRGAAVNSIAQAKAKLVLTYTYDASSASYTNTVIYPLESAAVGDKGSMVGAATSNCARNSTCPLFNYRMDIAESSFTPASRWFQTDMLNDANVTTDVVQSVNIQGSDVDSQSAILESSLGGSQGSGMRSYFPNVSGFLENANQQLEIVNSVGGGAVYMTGGEVFETYTAPVSSAVKTKTVRYPIGEIASGGVAAQYNSSVAVYLPETGVTIKKAWFRISASADSKVNAGAIDVATKVGSNSETATTTYAFNTANTEPLVGIALYHVIPAADYGELALASGSVGKYASISVRPRSTAIRGISAELVVTYSYTSDDLGYQVTDTVLAGQQNSAPNRAYSTVSGGVDPTLPETTGNKTVRGAFLVTAALQSDSSFAAPGGPNIMGANLSIGSCTANNTHQMAINSANSYGSWYKNVTSVLSPVDSYTYTACYANSGDGNPTTLGAKHNGMLVYTYQVDLPKVGQAGYRWFGNVNATSVGSPLSYSQDLLAVVATSTPTRLRFLLHVSNGQMGAGTGNFKLQYAQRSGSCDTAFVGESYQDIVTASGDVRFYDNALPNDGDALVPAAPDPIDGVYTVVNQTYEESNNFTNASDIPGGQDGKWDAALVIDGSAPANARYCIRAVAADGGLLDSYFAIPELSVAGAPPFISNIALNGNQNIILMEATTTAIILTATVSDPNGFPDIKPPIGKTYRSGVGSTCTNNANNCYSDSTCTLNSCVGDSCEATCTFNVQYFADPTDMGTPWENESWLGWMQVEDSTAGNASLISFGQELLSLLALQVSSLIDYGSLQPGERVSPLSMQTTATSTGNVSLDLVVQGANMTAGTDAIDTNQQRYAVAPVNYFSGIVLQPDPGSDVDANMAKITTPASPTTFKLYWGLEIPNPQPTGDYSGMNTFFGVRNQTPWP